MENKVYNLDDQELDAVWNLWQSVANQRPLRESDLEDLRTLAEVLDIDHEAFYDATDEWLDEDRQPSNYRPDEEFVVPRPGMQNIGL